MRRVLPFLTVAITLATLSACVAYTPVPVVAPQPSLQQRFERSCAAAAGAMADPGVTITSQDKAAGVMRGDRGGMPVTATVQTQADGSLRVSFEASAAADKDPGLADRLSESYLRRTGR